MSNPRTKSPNTNRGQGLRSERSALLNDSLSSLNGNSSYDSIKDSSKNNKDVAEVNEYPRRTESSVSVVSNSPHRQDAATTNTVPTVSVSKVLPALLLGVVLAALDNTIVASTYTKIGAEFGKFSQVSWTATAYMISCTAFQPLFGKFCDIYGRKKTLLAAYCVFGIGCFLCGTSRSLWQLVAARAIAGIGGGGMNSTVSILMSDIVPLKQRGTYQGIINVFFAIGSSLGGPVGGYFADQYTWRIGFLIQVPLIAIAFLCVYFTLNLPHHNHVSFMTRFRKIDLQGLILLIIGVTTMTCAFTLGGNVREWNDPVVISLLIASAISYLSFVYVEAFVASEPLAPMDVLTERTCLSSYLCNFFHSVANFGWIYGMPLFFQSIKNEGAEKSGIRLIPMIIGSSLGSLLGGAVISLTGNYKKITVGSYFFGSVAALFMLRYGYSNFNWEYAVYPFSGGLGNGIAVTTTLVAIIHASPSALQASAIATSYLFRSNGCVLGVSISSSIVQTVLGIKLRKSLDFDVDELLHHLRKDISYVHRLPEEIRQTVLDALLGSIHYSFLFVSFMFFCAFVCSMFIKNRNL